MLHLKCTPICVPYPEMCPEPKKRPSTDSYINIVYSRKYKYNLSINNNGSSFAEPLLFMLECRMWQLRRFFSLYIFLTHSLSHITTQLKLNWNNNKQKYTLKNNNRSTIRIQNRNNNNPSIITNSCMVFFLFFFIFIFLCYVSMVSPPTTT